MTLPGSVPRKSKLDVYTVLLVLALLFILLGCYFLMMEIAAYDWEIKGPTAAVSGLWEPGSHWEGSVSKDAPSTRWTVAC